MNSEPVVDISARSNGKRISSADSTVTAL